MFHFTRALIAAAITSTLMAGLVVLIRMAFRISRLGGMPGPGFFSDTARVIPQILGMIVILLFLVSVPVILLWIPRATRRCISRPWLAAIIGAFCGLLISPIWYSLVSYILGDGERISIQDYQDAMVFIIPLTTIGGATGTLLHSFLIGRATARSEWLASRPPSGRSPG